MACSHPSNALTIVSSLLHKISNSPRLLEEYSNKVSSANRRGLRNRALCRSLMYSRKRIGPNTDPCRTSDFVFCVGEILSLVETYCFYFNK